MARSMTLSLGGKQYELVASWKASMDIAENVMDPVVLAKDAALTQQFLKHNIAYDSKFEFTAENTARILHCALRSNGHELTFNEVGEAMVSDGIIEHVGEADKFISLLISNGSEEVEDGKSTSGKL